MGKIKLGKSLGQGIVVGQDCSGFRRQQCLNRGIAELWTVHQGVVAFEHVFDPT